MNRIVRTLPKLLTAALLLLGFSMLTACHSYHIEATVENHTGGTVTLLEVDYPSASFGKDTLAADEVFHHRIQTRGDGPISVQYTGPHGRTVQVQGPQIYEQQEGSIEIVLLPNGKAEFHPALSPQHS
ncbi:hypothetical protein P8935_17020 [Telmatobacter sp. DSM 110680]|uniref:Uncharacterized protein n=1 Tax=Telmatobacter sp. DSM 110680 TaxID=3036704 RepID=A0AAU7DEM0_9BACT